MQEGSVSVYIYFVINLQITSSVLKTTKIQTIAKKNQIMKI